MILGERFADNLKEMRNFSRKLAAILLFGLLALPVCAFGQVDTAWVRRYNGPGNDFDEPWAVAVDDSGSVYVAGTSTGSIASWTVLRYDKNGDLIWVRHRPGVYGEANFVVLDSAGNVYVTGTSESSRGNYDYTTIKYGPQGNEIWATQYDGSIMGADWALCITLDKKNNAYITGSCADSSSGREIVTIKYDREGNQRWVARYNNPLNLEDEGRFISIDDYENVYVAGYGGDFHGCMKEWVTIKYDSLGQEKWSRTFNLWPNGCDNLTTGIKLDASGNIIVTGGSMDSSGKLNYITIKYDSLGNTIWVVPESMSLNNWNMATALELDYLGNVYVSGYSGIYTATIKYDFNGNKLWEHRYTGPAGGTRGAVGIKLDKSGNIYVVGSTTGIGTSDDFTTIKLDSIGNELWVVRYNGQEPSSDVATSMAFDIMGNVYITGRNGNYDFVTVKYVPLPALKGDLNLDGVFTMADVVLMFNFTYVGEPFPAAPMAGDLNCDGKVSAVDAVIMLQMFFLSTLPPC